MTKTQGATLEEVARSAGIDLAQARAALVKLDEAFGGSHGDIPEGALHQWVNAHFYGQTAQKFFVALGKAWEQDIASGLSEERKKERDLSPEQWIKHRDSKGKKTSTKE